MHSSSYFYIITWFLISFLVGSELTSSDSSAKSSLDSLLQQYAFRQLAWQRTRVGVPYDAYVPDSLTGIKISAVILKTYSLKRKVYGNYKNFFIPSGILEEPYVKKLVLVYQNLANWSSFYYPLPGYTYLAPVFGILAYNAHDLYAKSIPELDIQALKDPISIKFPYVQPASEGSFPKCVYFYSNNLVEFGHVKDGNICETRIQGHFSIVAQVKIAPNPPIANEPAPSPSPTADEATPSPSPTADETAPSPSPSADETAPSPSPSADEAAPSPSPSTDEAAPSPSPSADEAAPSPSPSADEAAPSPSPTADEAAPSPSPTADETAPSPSPSADETAPSPSPSADETAPSPSPSADETAPSPSPSADEAAPSPSPPSADEAAPSPSPSADEAAPSPSPSADEAAPSPSPSADEAAPSPSPTTDEAVPSPSPTEDETAPSPSPTTDEATPSSSPTANETAPSPSHTSDDDNHQKVNSKMLRISSVVLFFALIGTLFVFVKNIELLEIKQKLYDSAAVIQPLLGTTELPLPLEAPTRPLLENDYVR